MTSSHSTRSTSHKLMVDASALIALFDRKDQYHNQALAFRDSFILNYDVTLFTSNYVYSEAMSHLSHLRTEELHRLDSSIRNPSSKFKFGIKQLWVSKKVVDKAVPIFFKYLDHNFSITDCTCFVLMQEYGITAAFTFDDDYHVYKYYDSNNTKQAFWKLPEMLPSYLSLHLPQINIL